MNSLQQPYFPSCFSWKPVTREELQSGKVKPGVRQRGNDPREIYGVIDTSGDKKHPVYSSREKYATIACLQPFIWIPRVIFRVGSLLSGDFIRPGVENGKYEWQLKCQKWSLQSKDISLKPGVNARRIAIAKHVAIECAKNVVKIPFYVLMVTPLFLIALYGLICNPYDADVAFGSIENLCARNWIPLPETNTAGWNARIIQLGDYLAACKQPNGVINQKNLYRLFKNYNSGTYRSQIVFISNELMNKREFFHAENIPIEEMFHLLQIYKDNLRQFSLSDELECDSAGRLLISWVLRLKVKELLEQEDPNSSIPPEADFTKLRDLLKDVINGLKNIETQRENGETPERAKIATALTELNGLLKIPANFPASTQTLAGLRNPLTPTPQSPNRT